MSRRLRLLSLLDRAGLVRLAVRAQKHMPLPFLRIVTYHRIGDPSVLGRELDEGVIDVTAEDYERHIAFLAKSFNVVGIEKLRRFLVDGVPLPKNAALITFDDGYLECATVGVPILQRYGVKGVFFVSTDHVGKRKVFWWDRISYLFKRSVKKQLSLSFPTEARFDLETEKKRAIEHALTVVKTTYGLDLDRFLDELARALEVPWTAADERRIADESIMSWDHCRELHRLGMDIESHTATHRVLGTLSDEDLARELSSSKTVIETELDKSVCSIAYPSGGSNKSDSPIGRAVRAAGYEVGFSGTGICRLDQPIDPLNLHRLGVDVDFPQAYFRASVAVPYLGF